MKTQNIDRCSVGKPLFFVDFDLTLFDTTRFCDALFSSFASVCSLSVDSIERSANNYYVDPVLGGYDIELHASSLGIAREKTWLLLREVLKINFLYDDSYRFLNELITAGYSATILSFGDHRFQSLKIQQSLEFMAPEIRKSVDIRVVQERKTRYIQKNHPGQFGMLIDDVPDQSLPQSMLEVQIMRGVPLSSPLWRSDNEVKVSSLEMIVENLGQLLARSFTSPTEGGILSTNE